MPNRFDISRQERALKQTITTLPIVVGDLSLQFFNARFRAQGWLDSAFDPWDKRSPKAKRNKGRAILTNTGRLRRSIRVSKLTSSSVTIGTDVPYAKIHNEGFKGTVNVRAHNRGQFTTRRVGSGKINKNGKEGYKTMTTRTGAIPVKAHTRNINMPKRQFIGESQYLTNILQRKITTEILKALK